MDITNTTSHNRATVSLFLAVFITLSIAASAAAASGVFKAATVKEAVKAEPNIPVALSIQPRSAPIPANIRPKPQVARVQIAVASHTATIALETISPAATTSTTTVATVTATTTPADTTTVYTTQTLAPHNKPGDCYVAYAGKVYNMSNQQVWAGCNDGGVVGGADVTANFANAAYYFNSMPQVGIYVSTTVATVNTPPTATPPTTGAAPVTPPASTPPVQRTRHEDGGQRGDD